MVLLLIHLHMFFMSSITRKNRLFSMFLRLFTRCNWFKSGRYV